ncbi:helix-turn-helix domain-containing protein [Bacillus manliponensis]|uniref:helix-turn-helix domain-containing protein n=1 Tax=Bacillus manliponensis TaxID=574376 RepID=UPI00068BEC4A|nr:helix-turn-helix transcriptional regulator [Bacillus manliponensis]
MKTLSIFSQRATMLREEQGLRQQDLADKLSVSRSSINSYENAHREPDFDVLIQYARFFNVSTDFLLGLTDEKLPYIASDKVITACGLLMDIMSDVDEEHHDEILRNVMRYARFLKKDVKDHR